MEKKPLNSVCAYDPITQEWSDKEPMNQRIGCCLTAYNGKLYAVGGVNNTGEDGWRVRCTVYRGTYKQIGAHHDRI